MSKSEEKILSLCAFFAFFAFFSILGIKVYEIKSEKEYRLSIIEECKK